MNGPLECQKCFIFIFCVAGTHRKSDVSIESHLYLSLLWRIIGGAAVYASKVCIQNK